MNRYKFRGLRTDGKGWVTGDLVNVFNSETGKYHPYIVISYNHDTFDWIKVIAGTVGQSTVVLDSFGKEMFEGDKVEIDITTNDKSFLQVREIVFEKGGFKYRHENGRVSNMDGVASHCVIRVVGSIHEKGADND